MLQVEKHKKNKNISISYIFLMHLQATVKRDKNWYKS